MKFALTTLVLLTILIVGCTATTQNEGTTEKTTQPPQSSMATIAITSSGFSPAATTVKSGDTVNFVNKDTKPHWVASAPHPTHEGYPEPGGCIGSKFDSCGSLAPEETFRFTFTHKGTWKYHDHLNPSITGTITVE